MKILKTIIICMLLAVAGLVESHAQPTGAINGLFSIAEGQYVYFSKGNLQYRASDDTWRFANNQYDYVGSANSNISVTYNGWIDLFGWGTSGFNHGAVCYQPWSTSTKEADYYAYGLETCNLYDNNGQADWGYNKISNGGDQYGLWRTLTSDEWNYILDSRLTDSGIRFAFAIVNDVYGLILLPDDWNANYYSLQRYNTHYFNYDAFNKNVINLSDWTNALEAHGAVFLPVANNRGGSNYQSIGEANYWAANPRTILCFYYNSSGTWGGTTTSGAHRYMGRSARLVYETSPSTTYTITTSANPSNGGTVSGTGTYSYGSTCSLTAIANPGYSFIKWTKNNEDVSYLSPFSFSVSEGGDYVAVFEETSGVVVGVPEGANQYVPSYSLNSYALSQQIYTNDEIGERGTITDLSFFNTGEQTTRNYDIYLVHTDKSAFGTVAGPIIIIEGRDWIAVTESDLVFSGTVTMATGCWTTVALDTPFAYNGTSNLAVVIDDNTGSGSANMSCRAFHDQDRQAVSVCGNVTNYDPYNPSGYGITSHSLKNQMVFQISPFNITALANPTEGGTVSGSGTYQQGQTCTMTATANTGYTFTNWTENGVVVSTNASYSFTFSGNRTLVANFSLQNYSITASANPSAGGTVSGAGTYSYGSTCTLTATANPGYTFIKWTKNGENVSYLSPFAFRVTEGGDYVAVFEEIIGVVIGAPQAVNENLPSCSFCEFSLSQQIYTNDEIGGSGVITGLSFFNTRVQYTRNFDIYLVPTNKTFFSSDTDWISVTESDLVFSGDVDMASGCWTTIMFDTPFLYNGTSNLAVVVDDNTYIQYFSLSRLSCRVFDTQEVQAIKVSGNGNNYDPYNPSGYGGTRYTVKNQIMFQMTSIFDITVSVDPAGGGTVTGAGSYDDGTTCTLIATPNDGFAFVNWTENGEVVSIEATYSFTVEGDRDLVANFDEVNTGCNIVFDLYDSYGDGWNGNYLVVSYGDVTEQYTIVSGSHASYSLDIVTGSVVSLSWIKGSYIGECSFDIKFENGVPIYHGSNLSATFQEDIAIDCELATAPYLISATTNPSEGGAVEGSGVYEGGSSCTLHAIPNPGYIFVYWTENGQPVSTDATYSFTVTGNRDLVAYFSAPLTITVSSNPSEGGTVTGAGVFDYGNTCTLTAIANPGYTFIKWTKNGEAVSYFSSFSFLVTEDADYVAVFEETDGIVIGVPEGANEYLPSYSYYKYALTQQIYTHDEIGGSTTVTGISLFNTGGQKTRNYDIYLVHTDKATFSNNKDWITVTESDRVFSGDVTMMTGCWTTIEFDMPFAYNGTSNLAIVVDDNSGNYTGSPHMACRVFNTQGTQAIRVYSDDPNYDPYNPSGYGGTLYSVKNQIVLQTSLTQTVQLSSGWNWFSTYLSGEPTELLQMLENSLGSNGIVIKSNAVSTDYYDDYGWYGDLDDEGLKSSQMYMIKTNAACTVELEGVPATSAEVGITIRHGWNWIGFPCAEAMSVAEALAGFQAEDGDILKSSGASTDYYEGFGWYGELETMEPGQGFMYYSNSPATKTVYFQTGAKKSLTGRKN